MLFNQLTMLPWRYTKTKPNVVGHTKTMLVTSHGVMWHSDAVTSQAVEDKQEKYCWSRAVLWAHNLQSTGAKALQGRQIVLRVCCVWEEQTDTMHFNQPFEF